MSTLAEASEQVRAAISREPDAALADDPPAIRELTTPELWARPGAQMFRAEGGYPRTFLVRGDECVELGESFGGLGVVSFCVVDLDADGQAELAFTCAWGSGIHRTEARAVVLKAGKLRQLKAPTSYFGQVDSRQPDLVVRVGGPGEAALEVGSPSRVPNVWASGIVVGRLRLTASSPDASLHIELDPGLTEAVRAQFR